MANERSRSFLAVVVALLLHALMAAGLALAQTVAPDDKVATITVDFKVPDAPVLTPKPEDPEPKEPDQERPVKAMSKLSRPPERAPDQPAVPPEDLAPGPASDEPPAANYTFKMKATDLPGTVAVARGGRPTGNLHGTNKGKGDGKGGGGSDDATGTQVATVASIKTMPRALGDNDFMSGYKYPPAARDAKIEGQVSVHLLVGKNGEVTVLSVIKGLGHGLDAAAKRLAKKLRFAPATDTSDRNVAVRITWTFDFVLPD